MTMAAEQVAGDQYLLEEILILLPAKSLARSKLVSKQWLSHISNPRFVQRHSRFRPNKSPTGMFVTDSKAICSEAGFVPFNSLNPSYQTIPSLGFLYNGIKHLVVDDDDEVSEIQILKSCNGLLLCLVSFNSSNSSKYCVCNPTTKSFRLLPSGPLLGSFDHNAYLGFDPSVSLHYKVVCTKKYLNLGNDHGPFEISIYSSENHCWRTHACHFGPPREGLPFLNGPIYWLCDDYSICFNVDTQEMKRLTVPHAGHSWICLAADGSHLCNKIRRDYAITDFRVLEMSRDFSEWVAKYDVCVGPLLSAYPEMVVLCKGLDYEQIFYNFEPLCAVEGVKGDEHGMVIGIHGKLLSYNLKQKTAKELCELPGELSGQFGYMNVRVFQFTETLYVV